VFTAAGPVVVAGLGLALTQRVLGEGSPPAIALARRLHPAGAAAAVGALAADRGALAGLLATAWFAVCVCAAAGGVAVCRAGWQGYSWLGPPGTAADPGTPADPVPAPTLLPAVTLAAGLAYLAVGGLWLVISRLGLHPFGLSTDIVRLTSVHFHYAGFGLPALAGAGLLATDWLASRVALGIGCIASVAGPPLVALGFTFDSFGGQVGGAVTMTVAAWAVAFGTFLLATSSTGPAARGRGVAPAAGRTLLVVAALSPLVPMVLAVQWALAQHTGVPALGIDDMAATHGVLNGAGFVVAGLAGWLLVGLAAPAAGPEIPEPVTD
jgi:YndJ-like protein